MNIRKNVDYSDMYAALERIMAADMPQMELYCEIGNVVCHQREKGAAVAAAAYLSDHYPDAQGFSPRNLRRMRDFYRAYEDQPALLSLALQLGWTHNIVILEADLSMELRGWYLKAVKRFGWSKSELIEKIETNAHEMIVLAIDEEVCYIERREKASDQEKPDELLCKENKIRHLVQKARYRVYPKKEGGRRWPIMSCPIFTGKRIVFTR
ncbi:MAG: DUF1016 N-terminal domain-containing protein, partial [Faecousia sp.]